MKRYEKEEVWDMSVGETNFGGGNNPKNPHFVRHRGTEARTRDPMQ